MAKGGKRSSRKGGMKSFSMKGAKGGKQFKFGRPAGCCSVWLFAVFTVLAGSCAVLLSVL